MRSSRDVECFVGGQAPLTGRDILRHLVRRVNGAPALNRDLHVAILRVAKASREEFA
jgi:hypothetical protein